MKRLKALSLFSNVGVSECYLKENGIDVVVANELEKDRADFYRLLYPDVDMVQGDITKQNVIEKIKRKVNEFDIDFNNCYTSLPRDVYGKCQTGRRR